MAQRVKLSNVHRPILDSALRSAVGVFSFNSCLASSLCVAQVLISHVCRSNPE